MNVPKVIAHLQTVTGWSQARLADRLGVNQPDISRWKKGSEPKGHNMEALRSLAVEYGVLDRDQPTAAVSENVVMVARYAVRASAGDGAVVLAEEVADWFRVGRDWLERYVPRGARTGVIEARGDSMHPTIRDGDILLLNFDIDRQDVANGGVFVITIDGNLFVKRLQIMLDGSIQIMSDNELYDTELVDREYADEKMRVHAQVVWAGGPLR